MDEILEIIARGVRWLTAWAFIGAWGWMIYACPRVAGAFALSIVIGWAWFQIRPKKGEK